jgi:hypothetical protein
MEKSQRTGLILMIGAVLEFVVFFWLISRKSYLALALPVMSAVAVVNALAFWIGWTMFTGEDEDLDDEGDEPEAAAA